MVNVLIATDTRYPVNRKVIKKAVQDVIANHKIESLNTEVSVAVVGSRKMNELSKKYMKDEAKHDVLAFALEEVEQNEGFVNPPDETLRLGDVVICWPWVLEGASFDNMMVDEKVYFLVNHGVEHLLGEHHE